MISTVVILGFGEIGKALNAVLERAGHQPECWDKNVDILPHQRPLNDIIPTCRIIFLCVPTWILRSAMQEIKHLLRSETILVSVSKGFEKETCTRVDHLLAAVAPKENPIVFLAGPMIAEELITGARTEAVAVSTSEKAQRAVADLFSSSSLHVVASDDREGVITAASLKNIYALGLGICDGLDLGANAHGTLVSYAVREMQMIIVAHHGKPETALSPAGIGDLVATAQSPNSTNYTTGVRIARGQTPMRGSEGMNTLPCIATLMHDHLAEMPFLSAITDIVLHHAPAQQRINHVLGAS